MQAVEKGLPRGHTLIRSEAKSEHRPSRLQALYSIQLDLMFRRTLISQGSIQRKRAASVGPGLELLPCPVSSKPLRSSSPRSVMLRFIGVTRDVQLGRRET